MEAGGGGGEEWLGTPSDNGSGWLLYTMCSLIPYVIQLYQYWPVWQTNTESSLSMTGHLMYCDIHDRASREPKDDVRSLDLVSITKQNESSWLRYELIIKFMKVQKVYLYNWSETLAINLVDPLIVIITMTHTNTHTQCTCIYTLTHTHTHTHTHSHVHTHTPAGLNYRVQHKMCSLVHVCLLH